MPSVQQTLGAILVLQNTDKVGRGRQPERGDPPGNPRKRKGTLVTDGRPAQLLWVGTMWRPHPAGPVNSGLLSHTPFLHPAMGKAWACQLRTHGRGCRHLEDYPHLWSLLGQGRTVRLGNQPKNGFQKAGWASPGPGSDHFSPGECVPGIVHDTVKVIGLSQGFHFLNLHLQEVILLPCKEREKSGGGAEGVACVLPVPVRGCLSEGVRDAEGKGNRNIHRGVLPSRREWRTCWRGRVRRPQTGRRKDGAKNRTSKGQVQR